MFDPIKAAIDYANDKEHDGAGFSLILHTAGGGHFAVDVHPGSGADKYRLYRKEERDLSDGNPLFPNIALIAAVEVVW